MNTDPVLAPPPTRTSLTLHACSRGLVCDEHLLDNIYGDHAIVIILVSILCRYGRARGPVFRPTCVCACAESLGVN